MQEEKYVINGSNLVVGRVASAVAKMLLKGNSVVLLNSEMMVMSGHLRSAMDKYKRIFELQDKANPEHSPYWSRRPDLFVKRIVRGMLPYKAARGRTAYKRLRVYTGIPSEFKDAKPYDIKLKKADEIYEKVFYVKDLLGKL